MEHKGRLSTRLNNVPREIDQEVAFRKLGDWGVRIDTLTPEQKKYIFG